MRKLICKICAWLLATSATGLACAQEAITLRREDQKTLFAAAYVPNQATCQGIAIISPGAGGSAQGYRYLGQAMASMGYLAMVLGHPESGRETLRERLRGNALREALAELITEPEAYRARFMDIAAARSWAKGRCGAGESLLIGHSMGAATALMESGARNKLGVQGTDAFSAYIALSPQGAGAIFPDGAWSGIHKPVLLLTGTNDQELGGASWQTRTEPFQNMPPGCKWQGIIEGASHMNFAGSGLSRKTEALTIQTIGAFLSGIHRRDCSPPGPLPDLELTAK